MDAREPGHRLILEDGTVMSFRSISFGSQGILADGRVFPYSQVDEVHLMDE